MDWFGSLVYCIEVRCLNNHGYVETIDPAHVVPVIGIVEVHLSFDHGGIGSNAPALEPAPPIRSLAVTGLAGFDPFTLKEQLVLG